MADWVKELDALALDWANGTLTLREVLTEAYAVGFNEGQAVE